MKIKNIEGLKVSQIKELVGQGAEFVYFPYALSFVLMTLKQSSSIYFIRPYEGKFKYYYKHFGFNLIFGWWGFPWGPIYTIGSMYTQLTGGKDVTAIVLSELIQRDPEANISNYAINEMMESQRDTTEVDPVYVISK